MRLWLAICALVIIGACEWNGPPTAMPLPGATWGEQSTFGALVIIAVMVPLMWLFRPRRVRRRK